MTARPDQETSAQGAKGRIDELLKAAIRAGSFTGAAAGWRIGGDERRTDYGMHRSRGAGFGALEHTGLETGTAVEGRISIRPGSPMITSATWFDLASLTKPLVTNTLALIAAREGRIRLDARLDEHLGEARGKPVGHASLAQLLSHCSGLPAWSPLYASAALARDNACQGPPGSGRCPTESLHADVHEVLRIILDTELVAPPGTRVEYSCLGFILLGALLTRVLDEDLSSAFERRVARSLGLEGEIGFLPTCDRAGNEARVLCEGAREPGAERSMVREAGLDPRLVPPMEPGAPDDGNARLLGGVAGNAGLFGSVRGVLRLGCHLLECLSGSAGDGLLSSSEMLLATRPHSPPGSELQRGLGWQLATSRGCSAGPGLSSAAFGHTGFSGTSLWIDPEARVVTALLTNRNHPAHRGTDLHPLRRRLNAIVLAARRPRRLG